MAYEVVMPQLGLSMDNGHIIQWLKQPGDWVAAGDRLLEVESDKATVEVEAVESGILHIVQDSEDSDIPVGEVIAYLLAEGEEPPADSRYESSPAVSHAPGIAPPRSAAFDAQTSGDEAQDRSRPSRPPSSPAARRRARELGIDWRRAIGTGPGGRIKERDIVGLAASLETVSQVSGPATEARISPVAKRIADLYGIDISELAHRYPDRELKQADVEYVIREAVSASTVGRSAFSVPEGQMRRRPVNRVRRLIAERMTRSAHTSAAVTLSTEADATELVHLREALGMDPRFAAAPSYNALLAKLVATALLEHPDLNSSLDGDQIITWETVNIAIAVDTERGLVAPVIRHVESKSLHSLAIEVKELLPRTQRGQAVPGELTGSTFTITNLGQYEIDTFTPIINPPECAILGIGRLYDKWLVVEGEPAVRTVLTLSLTFDHRLVDGAPAARFLQRVKQLVEHPEWWLT